MSNKSLTDKEYLRFNRHIMMQEIGESGQLRFKKAKILIIGMGGLGCSAAQYLVAAGVGELNLIDHDKIESSNLQRQILYKESDVGLAKVKVAKNALLQLNPSVKVNANQISVFDCNYLIKVNISNDDIKSIDKFSFTAINCNYTTII